MTPTEPQLVPLAGLAYQLDRRSSPGQQLVRFVAKQLGIRRRPGARYAMVRGKALVTPVELRQLDLDPESHRLLVAVHRAWALALLEGDREVERRWFREWLDNACYIDASLPPFTARFVPSSG